jgi:hypothetical protein
MAEMHPGKRKDAEKEKNTATLSKISNAIKGSEKLDVEGTDLLELLSHLEGELQARDVAIAALKSEQLKRLLYGCYQGSERSTSPVSALQRDNTTGEDANRIEEDVRNATCVAEIQIAALQTVVERQKTAARKMAACLRESEKQRVAVVGELDEERAKHEQDTAQGDDITYQLEKERIRLRQDLEVEVAEKQKLEAALKDNMTTLEEEKSKQKQIVLVRLADRKKLMKLYLEEKKRSEDLAQMLGEEKTKMDTMAAGLEEESKRSLAMEAELEKHLSQFGSERQQLRDKLVTDERRQRELEEALRKARVDVEHFKKQLSEAHRVAMSQAAPPPPYPSSVPLSVSPTPRQSGPVSQSQYSSGYTPYSTYQSSSSTPVVATNTMSSQRSAAVSSSAGPVSSLTARAPGLSPGSSVSRSQSGPMPGHPAVVPGSQPLGQQSHTLKFHSNTYTPNSTAGGFGHASHPALIPAGVPSHSHMDQESLPNSDISAYSQLTGPKPGVTHLLTKPAPQVVPTSSIAPGRKPLADSAAQANVRKPALGKGVPPPLPPNKPVVPVKKDNMGCKRTDSGGKDISLSVEGSKSGQGSSLVSGLQGLKFGISISNSEAQKSLKPGLSEAHAVSGPSVPAKKFFNNIESKS